MSANAPINQATANAQNHTYDVRDPVVEVGAAVEAGLDEFNGASSGQSIATVRVRAKARVIGMSRYLRII